MENRWPIEIDGLPIEHGDFPWRTVSHNQMVYIPFFFLIHCSKASHVTGSSFLIPTMLMQGTWQMMTFGVYSPYVGTPFSWHTHTYIYIYTLYTCRIIHTRIVYFIFILLYTHTCTLSPHIWSCSYSGQAQGLFRSLFEATPPMPAVTKVIWLLKLSLSWSIWL